MEMIWVSLQQKGRRPPRVGVQQITFNKMNGGFHLDQMLGKTQYPKLNLASRKFFRQINEAYSYASVVTQ